MNSASVLSDMGYCNPPLGDIKKCDHRELRLGASKKYEEPVCQCDEGDIGWFVGRGIRKKVEVRKGEYTYIREGISHTKRWEEKKKNRRFTLRIDEGLIREFTKDRRTTKGRMRSWKRGKKRSVGGPARGFAHFMRRQSLLALHEDPENYSRLLSIADREGYKPGKKKDIVLHMPCLESAVSSLVEKIEERRSRQMRKDLAIQRGREFDSDSFDYPPHHLLQRGWAPTLCRLIELRLTLTKQMMEEKRSEGEVLIGRREVANDGVVVAIGAGNCHTCGTGRYFAIDERRGESWCQKCGEVHDDEKWER